MIVQNTTEGASVTQSWTAHVNFYTGQPYSETFTHQATVPTGIKRGMNEGSYIQSWRSPTSDKSSFKAIIKSGEIKMTDYDVGTIIETDFIARVPRKANTFAKRGAYTLTPQGAFYNVDTHLFDIEASYFLVGDLSCMRSVHFPTAPSYSVSNEHEGELADLVADCMEQVFSSLNSAYDPLTDLAELRETLEVIHNLLRSAVSPIQTARLTLAALKKPREIMDAWMHFRYGLMPIAYSIKDALEALRRMKLVYHTERTMRGLKVNLSSKGASTVTHFFETLVLTAKISAVGKKRPPESEFLRLVDNISINPLKTAWELIPLSFVVDWFVNVGVYIEALSSALTSLSSNQRFCHATKIDSVRCTYLHDAFDDRRTLSTGPWTLSNGLVVFPRVTKTVGSLRNADYLLHQKSERSYSRRVFSPNDIGLRPDVFLNWKRWVDAFVLGVGRTRALLKGA